MKIHRKNTFYMLLLLPALALFAVFFVLPVSQSLLLSFTDSFGMRSSYDFIGLANYAEALRDKTFLRSILTTARLAFIAVVFGNLLSLCLALLMDNEIRGKNVFRAIFFIPNILSLLVVGYVWRFVYTNAVPELMKAMTGNTVALLGDPRFVVVAISVVAIWNNAGYYMVICIAALQTISGEILEAAKIDGSNAIQTILRIKIPMIMPTLVTCVVLSIATHFKTFELPYTMTSGGPAGLSTTMVLKIYHTAFNANRTGYATAQSTILFIIIASVSLILTLISRKKESYAA